MAPKRPTFAIIGGGPMALMTALEYVRNSPAQAANGLSEKMVIISKAPESRLGFGDILDTVHPEVLFNVPAGKMSFDPDPQNSLEFVNHLNANGVADAKIREQILRFNEAAEFEHQFVPRILLQPVAQKLSERLKRTAAEKGLEYEFIHGEVTNAEDVIPAARERKQTQSAIQLEIKPPERAPGEAVRRLTAEVAVIAFGSPKKTLPGEGTVKSSPNFCGNPNQPPAGHVLHPGTDLGNLPAEYNVIIAGSGLSAVDALIVLESRGYFAAPGRRATVVSRNGRFPYPHAAAPASVPAYKADSFLRLPAAPTRWVKPQTARDLEDSMVLTCLYAAGATCDAKSWEFAWQNEPAGRILARLARKAGEIRGRTDGLEREFIEEKFSAGRTAHGWQAALDIDFRPRISEIWKGFSAEEKKKWVAPENRHERLYNDLRHRVPVRELDLLMNLHAQNKIVLKMAEISGIHEEHGRIRVTDVHDDDRPFAEGDQLVKATGWEQCNPIDEVPLLVLMRRNGIVHRDNDSRMGVVVGEHNRHNVAIVGQLTKWENYEISGFQQLREHATKAAEKIRMMVREQS